MPKKRLTNEQQTFIIQCLARFKTPSETQELARINFDIEITRQSVETYDPTTHAGRNLRAKLQALFWEMREKFLEEIAAIDVSHKVVRLRELSELYHHAKKIKNYVVAAARLEQAAKEVGGIYTNKREHSGPNGGAIPLEVQDKDKALAGQMLKKLMDKGMPEAEARASLVSMGVNEQDIPRLNT
jgi:hypothetical protein